VIPNACQARRRAAAEETRARIVDAARDLLTASAGISEFTIDAVAATAGVARTTVYYQFGSKLGLVAAVFDSLAVHAGVDEMVVAIQHPDPVEGLAAYVTAFGRFYAADGPVLRRLLGLAAIDPEVQLVSRERMERRWGGLRVLAGRIAERHGTPAPAELDEATDVLRALTNFETFDAIAGTARSFEAAATLVSRLARLSLGLSG